MAKQFNWKHGMNETQEYYECRPNKGEYLCVFRNIFEKVPNTWMGFIQRDGRDFMVHDKTFCDRQRKKEELPPGCDLNELHCWQMLSNTDPEYMMRKVERCYKGNKQEICR